MVNKGLIRFMTKCIPSQRLIGREARGSSHREEGGREADILT